jgi:hypothetical protein
MRRIVVLFNELDREIWPKWLFRSRFILSPTGSKTTDFYWLAFDRSIKCYGLFMFATIYFKPFIFCFSEYEYWLDMLRLTGFSSVINCLLKGGTDTLIGDKRLLVRF